MKFKHEVLALFAAFSLALSAGAQSSSDSTENSGKISGKKDPGRNLIKLNLTSIFFNNYSLQYERILNKTISVAISGRYMPTSGLPFKNKILEAIGEDDPDGQELVEKIRVSNYAITPEIRFYLGKKGYGRGFYIAPYYRFASFDFKDLQSTYETDSNEDATVITNGKINSNSAGILFGAQWSLGKHICLDWWILGPQYGGAKGNFAGVTSTPLSEEEQESLRQDLEDQFSDFPDVKTDINVTANGATVKLTSPWLGIRAGITLGVRF